MKTTINYADLSGKEKQGKACLDIASYLGNPDVYERLRKDIANSERTWENFKGIQFALAMFAGIEGYPVVGMVALIWEMSDEELLSLDPEI